MKDVLIAAGFCILSRCSCSGTYTEKWIKDSNRVDIRPNRKNDQWVIRISGQIKATGNKELLYENLQKYKLV